MCVHNLIQFSIQVNSQQRGRTYAICLDNRKASYGQKTVFLAIDLRLNWNNPSPEELEMINKINSHMRETNDLSDVKETLENFDRMAVSMVVCIS